MKHLHATAIILVSSVVASLGCKPTASRPALSKAGSAPAAVAATPGTVAAARVQERAGTVAVKSADACARAPHAPEPLERVVRAIDGGEYDQASVLARQALAANPQDRGAQALSKGSQAALDVAVRAAEADLAQIEPQKLQSVILDRSAGQPLAGPRLRLVSSTKNLITDDEAWLNKHRLTPKATYVRVPLLPVQLHGGRSRGTFVHPDHFVAYYESGVVVVTAAGKQPLVFDARAPLRAGPVPFQVTFGQLVGDLLVLQLGYNGYAKQSDGKNAYLAAFGKGDGRLRWVSPPLRANAANFLVRGRVIISGYGFTAEPDYLYLTDLGSGKALQQLPVKSGPSFILDKGGRLYVRTYDRNLVLTSSAPWTPSPGAVLEPTPTAGAVGQVDLACFIRLALQALSNGDAAAIEQLTSPRSADSIHQVLQEAFEAEGQRLSQGQQGGIDLATVAPVVVKKPPWKRYVARTVKPSPKRRAPQLTLVAHRKADPVRNMDKPRRVSRSRPVFIAPVENGKLPLGARPDTPTHYAGTSLGAIIPSGERTLLVYGGRYLVVLDGQWRTERVFDLETYRHPPEAKPQWAQFAIQDVTHAQVKDGVVYVCNGGGSYAKEVRGKKGFVSAIALDTATLLWRSKRLVCNATLALHGDYLVTGYGFTAEPDFLHLLRRADGKVVRRKPLRTGPDLVLIDGDIVHVETYGDIYRFKLTCGKAITRP